MNGCLVSVLMPVYNADKYVFEAIWSILNQTYTDFEFIIINDGSTDNSEKIIQGFHDPRIVYVRNESNIRLVATLNKGIKMARGKYIMRMDADDISVADRIQEQVSFMEKNPDVGVCGSFLSVFGTSIKPYISKRPEKDKDIRNSLLVMNSLGHPNVMIRKSVMIDNNIWYDEKFYRMEDWGLWVSLMPYCKFYNIQSSLLHYRYVSTSESRKNKKDSVHLNISSEIVRLFFTNIGIQCDDVESREIVSIVKSPYIYEISWNNLKESYRTLIRKLDKANFKVNGVKMCTMKRLAAFSIKRPSLAFLMLNDIGLQKYVQLILYVLRQKAKQ